MTLPSNVKSESPWCQFLFPGNGRTILETIYIKRAIFDDLQTQNPKPESLAVFRHEQTHVDRIRKTGKLKFSFLYLFSRKFRFNEELEANKQAFTILKKNKTKVGLERKAKVLSSWKYLWPVSYQFARRELGKAWDSA